MKTQIKPTKSHRALASTLAWIPIAAASLALAAGASAQTLQPQPTSVELRPAINAIPVGPTLPSDQIFFGLFHGYTPADIAAAYGVDALHDEGLTGAGQTIVIVDSYGSPTALQDLQTFSTNFGLPEPDLTIVYPNGAPAASQAMHGYEQAWILETSLDLEWAHAIAPEAKLVLIAANPGETAGVLGFPSILRGVEYAAQQYPGSPISMSFGAAEPTFAAADDTLLNQFETAFQQADAAGCTPVAADGDMGTANLVKQFSGKQAGGVYPYPTVNWPASSPSVTAVGGTWLQYHWRWDPQSNWAEILAALMAGDIDTANQLLLAYYDWDTTSDQTEAVWNEGSFVNPFGRATGGGLSAVFPTPSWQSSLPSTLTQGARAVPDVSWSAASDGGVLVYIQGGWYLVYGTSCGSPQIAGVVALANQLRAKLDKGPIGHLAPKLYQLPASDFNDIVPQTFGTGDNAVTVQDNHLFSFIQDNQLFLCNVPGLPTTVGYDLTTGLGSPKAYSFVHDLATKFP